MRGIRTLLLLLALCSITPHRAWAQNYAPAAATPGTPGDSWYKRMTPALGEGLRAVTYGNGLWVAVGDNGAMLRSVDGKAWTEALHGGGDNMRAIAWTGTRYVAVGRVGSSYVSTDGAKWSRVSTSAGADLNAILWTGTSLIAVGNSGAVVISSDGLTWANATTKPPSTFSSNCLASDGTRLVSGGNGIYYSDDGGSSWVTATTPPTSNVKGLAWNGTKWVAAGESSGTWWLTSADATVWSESQIATGESPQALIQHNDQVLIATRHTTTGNGGELLYSSDAGMSWMGMAQPFAWYPMAVAKNEEIWVAVGPRGLTMTSVDGVTWENRYISGHGSWRSVIGNAQINAVSKNLPLSAILTSCLMEDHSDTLFKGPGSQPSRVDWNGSKYVAVGDQSVFVSTDGISWTDSTPDIFQFLPQGVCWNGSQWVIVATFGKTFTSSDAVNWTESTFPFTYPEKAISVGSQVVAIGTSGQIASTSDAINWSYVDLGIRDLNDITWHNGRYVVVGDYGFAATSTDGVNWSEITSVTDGDLSVVEWHNGKFIAVGRVWGKPVLTTVDGSAWETTSSEIGFTPTEAISVDGSLIAINTTDQRWAVTRDGLNWSIGSLAIQPTFNRGAWNGRYYAVSDTTGRYFLSRNGTFWEEQASRPLIGNTLPDGNGFVAISGKGISRTADSFNWVKVYDPDATAPYMYGLANSGSVWVAAGDGGAIIRSGDGTSWAPVVSGTTWSLREAVWAGDRFVASGYGGTVLTSPDGTTWQQAPTGRTGLIQDLVWTGSKLYALEAERYLLSTSDFSSWSVLDLGSATRVYSLIWTGDRLAGMAVVSSEAQLIESTDGTNWSYKPAGFYGIFNSLIWDGGQYLAVGGQGVVTSGNSGGGFDKWAAYQQLAELTFEEEDLTTGLPAGLVYAFEITQPSVPLINFNNSLSSTEGTIQFSAPKISPSDITYRLESSSTLASGSWNVLGSKAPGKNWDFPGQSFEVTSTEDSESFIIHVDKSASDRSFYRLRVTQN